MKYIKIKTEFEGFHKYENAPEEVKFLRNLHRHIFKVEVKIEVRENDRELEFFIVKRNLNRLIEQYKRESEETDSCEMVAEYILDYLEATYRARRIQVEVSEDGENSGIINNYDSFE